MILANHNTLHTSLSVVAAVVVFFGFVWVALAGDGAPDSPRLVGDGLAAADVAYLRDLAADTWGCIAYFVEPATGLPFDTSQRDEFTSVSNLGMYAASCGVAKEMRLIDAGEATERVRRVLDAYRGFKKWRGFSQSWNSVRTLEPSPDDTMVSVLDSANMMAGFIVAGRALPGVRDEVDQIVAGVDWAAVYDSESKLLFGGYDLGRGRLDRGWHIGAYATDGRMAAFLAIATGAAPPASWDSLERETERHYGLTVYRPAWAGGGLFMQAMHGLFLDERSTPIGRSTADFAYAQMIYAKQFDLPVWGWSACLAPDGRYLGWGGLETPVVTPHAVGLAAMYYPGKAIDCFKRLERFGARRLHEEGGRSFEFGFGDSVNFETGASQGKYLPPLDQAMLFLSLANVLEDRVVHRLFESHPLVQRGRQLIPEYAVPVDSDWLTELRRRDREPVPTPAAAAKTGPDVVLIDDFESDDVGRNRRGGTTTAWTRDPADRTVSVKIGCVETSRDDSRTRCLRVEYDVDSESPAYGGVTFDLGHADGSGCRALEMWLRGQPGEVKVELHGHGGTGVTYVSGVSADGWTRVRIPFTKFGGLISDWSDLERLILVFEDGRGTPKSGVLYVDDVRLVGTLTATREAG